MQFRRIFIGAVIALAAWSCNDHSPTGPGTNPGGQVFTVVLDTGIVDSSTFVVGTAIPFRVRVTQSGSPAVAAIVTWTVLTGHGSVASATSTTDSSGVASVQWTIGDTVGFNSASAAAGDGSATLRAVGVGGAASAINRVTQDTSSVVATGSVAITVRVVDFFGNPTGGATVTWTSTAGSINAPSTTTSASGNATTTFTTPAAPGTYMVTAVLPGQASITFTIVAL